MNADYSYVKCPVVSQRCFSDVNADFSDVEAVFSDVNAIFSDVNPKKSDLDYSGRMKKLIT